MAAHWRKIMPARFRVMESDDTDVVVDLDRMVAEPIAFRWNGKTHLIKALSAIEFLQYTQAFARLEALRTAEKLEGPELIEAYGRLFGAVCATIGPEEVKSMHQAQIGALFQLVIEAVQGKAHKRLDTEKKKMIARTA